MIQIRGRNKVGFGSKYLVCRTNEIVRLAICHGSCDSLARFRLWDSNCRQLKYHTPQERANLENNDWGSSVHIRQQYSNFSLIFKN